ncbi:MAG: hypothetical protein IJW16_05590 [Clostridia bacterium]|nr:hypothetical protein [Clostridia bacterium]
MYNRLIADAIGYLDYDLVENYFRIQEKYNYLKKKKTVWFKYTAIAAMLCLVVSAVFVVVFVVNREPSNEEFQLPVNADEIIWLPETHSGVSSEEWYETQWNHLTVSTDLYEALQNADEEQYIAILVQGKQGEAVEEWYDAFYEKGYCVTNKQGKLYLFIKSCDLEKLNVENVERYFFHLASRYAYEGIVKEDIKVNDQVTGFAIEKIYCEYVDVKISKDEDVALAITELANKWKYTYDSVLFTFFYDGDINANIFDDMQYKKITQNNYPPRYVVEVSYENINMQALMELSQRSDIVSIHIMPPLHPTSDS